MGSVDESQSRAACIAAGPCTYVPAADPVGADEFVCSCYAGFDGPNCERDIDECASHPCHNGGICTHSNTTGTTGATVPPGRFRCECEPGWEGVHCDNDVDECEAAPCRQGTCIDSLADTACHACTALLPADQWTCEAASVHAHPAETCVATAAGLCESMADPEQCNAHPDCEFRQETLCTDTMGCSGLNLDGNEHVSRRTCETHVPSDSSLVIVEARCETDGGQITFLGCEARGQCGDQTTLECPEGFHRDPSSAAVHCEGIACDPVQNDADRAACCVENRCSLPRDLPLDAYLFAEAVAAGDSLITTSSLGTIGCAATHGHVGSRSFPSCASPEYCGPPTAVCSQDRGVIEFKGCATRATCGAQSQHRVGDVAQVLAGVTDDDCGLSFRAKTEKDIQPQPEARCSDPAAHTRAECSSLGRCLYPPIFGAAIASVDAHTNTIALRSLRADIKAGHVLQLNHAVGQTCGVLPLGTDLVVEAVVGRSVTFETCITHVGLSPQTNCIITRASTETSEDDDCTGSRIGPIWKDCHDYGVSIPGLGHLACDATTHVAEISGITMPCSTSAIPANSYTQPEGCVPRAACSTMNCAPGTSLIQFHATELCMGAQCTPEADQLRCCETTICRLGAGFPFDGYVVTPVISKVSDLGAVTCNPQTHGGTPSVVCPHDNAHFNEPTGCEPFKHCGAIDPAALAARGYRATGGGAATTVNLAEHGGLGDITCVDETHAAAVRTCNNDACATVQPGGVCGAVGMVGCIRADSDELTCVPACNIEAQDPTVTCSADDADFVFEGCFPKGTCSEITCSGTQVAAPGKDLLDEANAACCVEKAECSSMRPPAGYRLRSEFGCQAFNQVSDCGAVGMLDCNGGCVPVSNGRCAGATCDVNDASDVATCCEESECTAGVPAGYVAEYPTATRVSDLGAISCTDDHINLSQDGLPHHSGSNLHSHRRVRVRRLLAERHLFRDHLLWHAGGRAGQGPARRRECRLLR